MRKLEPVNIVSNESSTLAKIIGPFQVDLDLNSHDGEQKSLELCHLAKVLLSYYPDFKIERLEESPDFIISSGEKQIAVEHQLIILEDDMSIPGFLRTVLKRAKIALKTETDLPNLAFFIQFQEKNSENPVNNSPLRKTKNALIEIVKNVVKNFLQSDDLRYPPIIKNIRLMRHTHFALYLDEAGGGKKQLDRSWLLNSILNKDKKVEKYRSNTGLELQWLLLVCNSAAHYSPEINDEIAEKIGSINIASKFDKILLLSDFPWEVWEIK